MDVNGISPLVSSCGGLVYKKAAATFRRLSPENKRWLDLDDVIQDGLIEAWQASKRHDPSKSKFSTYLYRGLDMLFNARYVTLLRQKKRRGAIVELDAPIKEDGEESLYREVRADAASAEDRMRAVSGLLAVCRSAPAAAVAFLVGFVVSGVGRIGRRKAEDVAYLPALCRAYGIGREEMDLVMADFGSRCLVLEGVLRQDGLDLGGEEQVKVLECFTCRERFSLADVRAGLYSASSLTCRSCIKKLASDVESACFGRRKVIKGTVTAREGYSPADAECRLHCRDRRECKRHIERKESRMSNVDLDLEDVDFSDVETEVKGSKAPSDNEAKTSKTASKSAKVADIKSAKDAEKSDAAKGKKAPSNAKTPEPAKKKTPSKTPEPAKKAPSKASSKGKTVGKNASSKPNVPRQKKSAENISPADAKKRGLIKLDEKGRDLPFKSGSAMRELLEKCLEPGGAHEKELEKYVRKIGYDWDFQRTVLVSGKSGDSSLRPYPSTHVWKVEEEKGRIRVFDVKRIAFYERMPRITAKG